MCRVCYRIMCSVWFTSSGVCTASERNRLFESCNPNVSCSQLFLQFTNQRPADNSELKGPCVGLWYFAWSLPSKSKGRFLATWQLLVRFLPFSIFFLLRSWTWTQSSLKCSIPFIHGPMLYSACSVGFLLTASPDSGKRREKSDLIRNSQNFRWSWIVQGRAISGCLLHLGLVCVDVCNFERLCFVVQ